MEGLQRMPPDADSRSQSILLSYASASPTWHPHQQQNSSNSLSCSANQICGFSQLESEGNSSNLSFGSLDVRSNAQNAVFCNLDSSRGSLMLLDSSNASATLAFFPVHSVLPSSSSQNDHLSPLDQLTRAASVQRKRRKRKRIETTFTTLTSDNKPPVAPSSAYLLFCKEKRLLVRRENPQLTFSELTKLLGAQWSAMSAKEKQMFFDKSSADKERYKRELEVYEANNSTSTASTTADGAARGLYCLSCDQYFNTSFNKEQHLLGKRHRLALIRTKRLSNKRLSTTHNTDQTPVDIETALFDFADKANEREVEIAFLIGAVEVATGRVFDLESKRQRLADTLSTYEQQLHKIATVMEAMTFEKRNLSMLFQTLT